MKCYREALADDPEQSQARERLQLLTVITEKQVCKLPSLEIALTPFFLSVFLSSYWPLKLYTPPQPLEHYLSLNTPLIVLCMVTIRVILCVILCHSLCHSVSFCVIPCHSVSFSVYFCVTCIIKFC